jgi:hypothetical protein
VAAVLVTLGHPPRRPSAPFLFYFARGAAVKNVFIYIDILLG